MKLKRRRIFRLGSGKGIVDRYSAYTHWKIEEVRFSWNDEALFVSMKTDKFEWEIEFTIDECEELMDYSFRSIQSYITENFKKLKKLK